MAKKTIKKSFIRIAKISILIIIRETYFFVVNLIGLIYHPFLTIKKIKKERNFLQIVLIAFTVISFSGLPILILLLIWFISHIFQFSFLPYLNKIIFLDLYLAIISILAILYLFYWVFKVIQTEKGK